MATSNPRVLLDNDPSPDPATLFVTPDYYVTRLLHADGVALDALGVGQGPLSEDVARAVWRRLCERWHLHRGTPVRLWLEPTGGDLRRHVAAGGRDRRRNLRPGRRTLGPGRLPRALYERFRIQLLATTDDPCSDLAAHAELAADST